MTNEEKAKELSKLEGSAYNPVVSSLIEKKALEMAKWKEEKLIDKAAKWFEDNFKDSFEEEMMSNIIIELKKAMKEE